MPNKKPWQDKAQITDSRRRPLRNIIFLGNNKKISISESLRKIIAAQSNSTEINPIRRAWNLLATLHQNHTGIIRTWTTLLGAAMLLVVLMLGLPILESRSGHAETLWFYRSIIYTLWISSLGLLAISAVPPRARKPWQKGTSSQRRNKDIDFGIIVPTVICIIIIMTAIYLRNRSAGVLVTITLLFMIASAPLVQVAKATVSDFLKSQRSKLYVKRRAKLKRARK